MSGADHTGLDYWVTEMTDSDPSGSPPSAQGRDCKMVCMCSSEGGGAPVSLGRQGLRPQREEGPP